VSDAVLIVDGETGRPVKGPIDEDDADAGDRARRRAARKLSSVSFPPPKVVSIGPGAYSPGRSYGVVFREAERLTRVLARRFR
jgi:hypothetical protein